MLSRAGVKVCLTADHDVTPLYYLPTYAEMAARYGMDQIEALKAVTLNPAQVLRIDDRKGSLQVGKDADLVVLEDNYDVLQTYCMGQPKL